ncbi:epoxide hydrolase [Blastomyces dermatitidis ER-3]|uniref:Uncharacterized protein n=2 Tax=Ajellomyces dermatitidis TaxID=5039 RepID=A0A0J9EMQ0_AJEDA|nr:epoxide hydrolase [Blastomyces dermatitidis ER-3]EEQ90352.2 epoxide hydrolase [Blastomyces dermatitidis ER-3]EQL29020.1 hypothetical protein BDFG_08283 [Blastomyces dermatitidis ATCC 26199]KMW67357.1 hypothetical protein BDDG_12072 [Blastomyces dermatitidis ATCC 18188]
MNGRGRLFIEVLRILPLLSQNNDDDDASSPAFHVVGPSLPNFGFSQGVQTRFWAQYAETCNKPMHQLGYPEMHCYHTARMYKRALKRNELFGREGKGELDGFMRILRALSNANQKCDKYAHGRVGQAMRIQYNADPSKKATTILSLQNLKTLVYALHDSPIVAWINEKLHDWSDAYPWTDDEILTWICIYAFSRAGPGAAHRIYFEVAHADAAIKNQYGKLVTLNYGGMLEYTEEVKIGLTYNPKELETLPTRWGGTFGNVVLSGGE